jgi:hypothetical protein
MKNRSLVFGGFVFCGIVLGGIVFCGSNSQAAPGET